MKKKKMMSVLLKEKIREIIIKLIKSATLLCELRLFIYLVFFLSFGSVAKCLSVHEHDISIEEERRKRMFVILLLLLHYALIALQSS
jgi:hypothetical protein